MFITLTYSGGPLEIDGDINICLEGPCVYSNSTGITKAKKECADTQLHNCLNIAKAGSAVKVQYEGVIDVGRDVKRGETLGYTIRGHLHSQSGVVDV